MKLRANSELIVALALILVLGACDRPGQTTDSDQEPPQGMQESANAIVDPHRYIRLSDLAGAIRKAGHPCEVVKAYKLIEQSDKGRAVDKVDCLEYSFRLTIINGQSRIEPFIAKGIRH